MGGRGKLTLLHYVTGPSFPSARILGRRLVLGLSWFLSQQICQRSSWDIASHEHVGDTAIGLDGAGIRTIVEDLPRAQDQRYHGSIW